MLIPTLSNHQARTDQRGKWLRPLHRFVDLLQMKDVPNHFMNATRSYSLNVTKPNSA